MNPHMLKEDEEFFCRQTQKKAAPRCHTKVSDSGDFSRICPDVFGKARGGGIGLIRAKNTSKKGKQPRTGCPYRKVRKKKEEEQDKTLP